MDREAVPTNHELPFRPADFATLAEALDYAAKGETGFSFYDRKGRLTDVLPYHELRERARAMAQRLMGMGLERGDRVAVIAENSREFPEIFFGCQYAGLVPVALPISLNLGGHEAYVTKLQRLLEASRPRLAVAPPQLKSFLEEAAQDMPSVGTPSAAELREFSGSDVEPRPTRPDEIAYLQFTSGSTRAPRGVVISQAAVMSNLWGIVQQGLCARPGDRSVSWLPFYHDLGLVGFLLGPVVSQLSCDYLRTQDFAVRPVQWLKLISQNRGTIAFSAPIGYWLCERRLRDEDLEILDLSSWRIAGIGAELIRLDPLEEFAERLSQSGFDRRAFLPCYGLAESTLAVSFADLDEAASADCVDADVLAERGAAVPPGPETRRLSEIVNCGQVLPGHEVMIRSDDGREVPERTLGRVCIKGPSVMSGYFADPESTEKAFTDDRWLDTGDLGYLTSEGLFITGRRKDLIIINGRNIWPQDLERLAERMPEVRVGDASAFGVSTPDGLERAVVVVQTRISDDDAGRQLMGSIQTAVYEAFGIHCIAEVVPSNTLPKTSSGKLSRVEAKHGFLIRAGWGELEAGVHDEVVGK